MCNLSCFLFLFSYVGCVNVDLSEGLSEIIYLQCPMAEQ